MAFGQIMKKLRVESNRTQEQLAELLNISPQAVSRWENNAAMPDISLLPPLANLFGVTTDYLLGISESPHKDTKKSPSTAEAAPGEAVSDMFDQLNDLLVSMGLIKDGDDLTAQQADILLAVCRILNAAFQD